ncbi:MAG: sigma-70 family RNA polymerase sigma factor [Myxococcaceae bacterium]|nr:sigma-70 family RNA polymerase sigma factor [Myxococcaceae bacterium]MBH2006360.1 sigma-70 family RNA polymerase sigma factor [Myxococcaceae bacterium]
MSHPKTKNEPNQLIKRSSVALPNAQGEWVRGAESGGDLYATFVRQATRISRLSDEEERTLGLRVRDVRDQEAAKKLVSHNMRLAIKIAHQYRRSWTSRMDLIQEALAGMSIAATKWDPDQNTRFGTYAVFWMKAQLSRFLLTNSRLIHTGNTRSGRRIYFALPEVRRELVAKGLEPTPERIAERLNEDLAEVESVLARLESKETSLSAIQDEVLFSQEENPESQTARREIQKTIHQLIETFERSLSDPRDLAIWQEHLIAHEPFNLVELGKRFGVSKQRMGQLADRLKKAFRRHVIDTLGPNTQLSWLFSEDSVQ